ncbi:RdgB/HAM1 family non-canonical purine NTP pyrophosphatase [bacterium]|nr:RdgB/HAM1 family non-canonical purine NTP pyrophosphatase [bacterium]
MITIVLATSNKNKVREINSIMNEFNVEFILPPLAFDPLETGSTFAENALIKAKEAYLLTKLPVLADDSGLCVDALNGEPGIFSARYAKTPIERIIKLLHALDGVPEDKRTAHFVCSLVLLNKNGEKIFATEGKCYGKIGFEMKGQNGFGYDPIFVVDKIGETMSQLSENKKNEISHRALALKSLQDYLLSNFTEISN